MKKYLLWIMFALIIVFGTNEYLIAQHGGAGAHGSVRFFLKRFNTNIIPSADNTYDIGSSTKRVKEIHTITGFKVPFIFGSPDIIASLASVNNHRLSVGTGNWQRAYADPSNRGPLDYRMPWDGSIVGISVVGTGLTAGIASFDVTVNGTEAGLIARFEPAGTGDYNTQNKDTDTFSADDLLGVTITTDSGFAPSGSPDVVVTVFVEI